MYKFRQWSVTHSRKLESLYRNFEPVLIRLHPLFKAIGYGRMEKPVRVVEKAVKSLMFDCQMCGKCALSSTGMSCPMNCPKSIRNGPCGGTRQGGREIGQPALAGDDRPASTIIELPDVLGCSADAA